jgi:hypothetical protein
MKLTKTSDVLNYTPGEIHYNNGYTITNTGEFVEQRDRVVEQIRLSLNFLIGTMFPVQILNEKKYTNTSERYIPMKTIWNVFYST